MLGNERQSADRHTGQYAHHHAGYHGYLSAFVYTDARQQYYFNGYFHRNTDYVLDTHLYHHSFTLNLDLRVIPGKRAGSKTRQDGQEPAMLTEEKKSYEVA